MLWYLVEWINQVYARSGIDMNGIMPLSYMTIDCWARLTHTHPEPYEVDALMQLDHIMRRPDDGQTEQDKPPKKSWPDKKKPAES